MKSLFLLTCFLFNKTSIDRMGKKCFLQRWDSETPDTETVDLKKKKIFPEVRV